MWMNLENFMVSERNQTQNATYFMIWFHLHEMSRIGKFIETESRLVVARGWEGGEKEEWLFNGYGVPFWGDENALEF